MIYIYCKTTEDTDVFNEVLGILLESDDTANVTMENRRSFRSLEKIKSTMKKDDILIISSTKSLGLNDADVANQLKFFADNSMLLVVCNTPSTYEYGVGQPMNKAVINTILLSIVDSNKKVIQTNKRSNAGRNKISFPDNWDELFEAWEKKEITSSEFIEKSGLKKATFYNMLTEYRKVQEKATEFVYRFTHIG